MDCWDAVGFRARAGARRTAKSLRRRSFEESVFFVISAFSVVKRWPHTFCLYLEHSQKNSNHAGGSTASELQRFFWALALFSFGHRPIAGMLPPSASPEPKTPRCRTATIFLQTLWLCNAQRDLFLGQNMRFYWGFGRFFGLAV